MNAYETLPREEQSKVDRLLADTAANGGLAPVDLDAFWRDQDIARADPFSPDCPQCCFGASLNWECVYAELGLKEDYWRYQHDEPWALDVAKRYNDVAEKIVGRRLLNEKPRDPARVWPEVKALHDIFEARNVWEGGPAGSWWLHQSANTPGELAALLDRVERRLENLRDFLLPENWDAEKARLTALGAPAPLYRGQRLGDGAPATAARGARPDGNQLRPDAERGGNPPPLPERGHRRPARALHLQPQRDGQHGGGVPPRLRPGARGPRAELRHGRLHQQRHAPHEHATAHGRHPAPREILTP